MLKLFQSPSFHLDLSRLSPVTNGEAAPEEEENIKRRGKKTKGS
jgi:hypothetical protein